jgi:hypothetical protein
MAAQASPGAVEAARLLSEVNAQGGAGRSAEEQVASVLALLRSGRLIDAVNACEVISAFAEHSFKQKQERAGGWRETAGAAGALAAVVGAMRTHPGDWQAQDFGCRALLTLCAEHAPNCARAVAAGAIIAVLDALPLPCPYEMMNATELLFLLTSLNLDFAAAAVAAGGLECVIAHMRKHAALAVLQQTCCVLLATLARLDSRRAVQAGAIEVVLTAVRTHGDSSGLCDGACGALRILYDDKRVVESSTEARARADASVRAALQAMDAHRADAGTQSHGCQLLGSIARNDCVSQAAIGARGIVPSVAAALRAHPGSVFVQMNGISAFAALCTRSGARAADAASAGLLELVLAAMQIHVEDETVVLHVCGSLVELLVSNFKVTAAHDARVPMAVLAAMRVHCGSANAQWRCCAVLRAFAILSAASLAMTRAAGAVHAVVGAVHMQRHAEDDVPPGELSERVSFVVSCILALNMLLVGAAAGDAAAEAARDAALRAGALERLGPVLPGQPVYNGLCAQLKALLSKAARRHDAAPCAHAAACQRCAAARARGDMCALPSCGARTRADAAAGASTKLLRCARCQKEPYCCAEHQRADWAARHKAECRKPEAGGSGASGSAQP